MARQSSAARSRRRGVLSLGEVARALGLAEDVLVALMREAGVSLAGPREGWRLDAADFEAVAAERDRLRERNRRELERLGEALEEG